MTIIVCPLSHVETICEARRPSHLLSLLDPGHVIPSPAGLGTGAHLRIGVHDICDETEGLIRPDESVVEAVLAFGSAWAAEAPMVVHCWAGISRSSASAFTLACARNPHADERTIAEEIRRRSPYATPNRRIVALADDILGRGGRMVDAADAIGRGQSAVEGRPFEITADW
jgi:predicted protein tyrosine phosphatase